MRALKIYGLVISFFSVIAIISMYPILVDPTKTISGYLDSRLMMWNFWWFKESLFTRGVNPFYCDWIFIYWKSPISLLMHTYVPFWGLFSVPFQYVLKNPDGLALSYNTIRVLFIIVAGVGSFYLTGLFCENKAARIIVSLVPPFYIFTQIHSYQLQYGFTGLFPFQFALMVKALRDDPKKFKWAMILLAVQAYCDLTYTTYMAFFAIIAFCYFAISKRKWPLPMVTMTCWVLIAFVLFIPWLTGVLKTDLKSIELWQFDPAKTAVSGTDPVGLFVPDPVEVFQNKRPLLTSFRDEYRQHFDYTALYVREKRAWRENPLPFETVFLGLFPVVLAVVGIATDRTKQGRLWGLAAAIFFVLSLGPRLLFAGRVHENIPLPFAFVHHFPPFSLARNPAFYMVPCLYCMLYYFARGAEAVLRIFPKWEKTAAVVLMSLVFLDQFKMVRRGFEADSPSFCEFLAAQKGDFSIVDLPLQGLQENELYMYYQTIHKKKMWGGFVSRFLKPKSASQNVPKPAYATEPADIIEYARTHPELQTKFLVIHKHFLKDEKLREALSQAKNFGPEVFEDEYAIVIENKHFT